MFLVSIVLLVVDGQAVGQDSSEVEEWTVEVVAEYPHDALAYTQGLVYREGVLYESTGRSGQSTLREVNIETGEALRVHAVNEAFFAEGLALVDDVAIQLTWTTGYAFVYDLATFETLAVFFYPTEGWGLCYDGEFLYMSDGSANIFKRDAHFFRLIETIPVTMNGEPVDQINELECTSDGIFANVWKSNDILQIDKASGNVTARIDASGLLSEEERAALAEDPNESAVLNGIAYDSDKDVFYVTGKLWPTLFEVRFVPVQ
jgi:glutaminyl-peptide cyclotransferase